MIDGPHIWQKSSYSGSGQENACVEIAFAADGIRLREGDKPGVVVTASAAAFHALLGKIRRAESL